MNLEALVADKLAHLPPGLLDHCMRVSRMARALAERAGVDPERAALGGLLHDVARAYSDQELLAAAVRYDLPVDEVEHHAPVLLHGPVGAAWARRELGVDDEEVLAAVAWHSTGRGPMSALEKIVLLADKIEPEKGGRYPGLEAVHEAALRDLNAGLIAYLDLQLRSLLDRRALIHPASIAARNAALIALETTLTR
jgi:predicted HD superfamily hydrolase involved in NAD metabolism